MANFQFEFSHVQVSNEGALAFYKKFGFEVIETSENYYKRIEPADAFVLEKKLHTSDSSSPNSKAITKKTGPNAAGHQANITDTAKKLHNGDS